MLSPLNTSMFPVALPDDVQREFTTSASASTWLLTVFALASAVGHPVAGYLADRLGPRRVLVAGLVITGLSALVAALATAFAPLVGVRIVLQWSTQYCAFFFLTGLGSSPAVGCHPSVLPGGVGGVRHA
jgi:MFS family permease